MFEGEFYPDDCPLTGDLPGIVYNALLQRERVAQGGSEEAAVLSSF